MKKLFVLLSILAIGCKKNDAGTTPAPTTKKEVPTPERDTAAIAVAPTKPIARDTSKDTVIYTADADTLTYLKKDFPKIYERFEKLGECRFIKSPDMVYYNDEHLGDFDCEVGQDEYYTLYAHYLQGINGIKKNSKQRKKLIAIYRGINELYGRLQYGGTYFGHQYSRIPGYAEFEIYNSLLGDGSSEKTYPIDKQKKLYIASLRQLIADESTIDFNSMGREKIERTKELNKIVDNINSQLTDIYYLHCAQEFHYKHYIYN